MTSGPEHFQRAEQLLGDAEDTAAQPAERDRLVARAQVHATLALAAAAALNDGEEGLIQSLRQEWVNVAG